MTVSVLVPRAGECPHRERAWQWVEKQYENLENLEVVEGWGDPDRWCKADAVADALGRATGDLLVVADADVYSEHLADAIDAVESGEFRWAAPHWHVRRLSQRGTLEFITGARDEADCEAGHYPVIGGGIVVLHREIYEEVPLDPRFVGWGSEDSAFGAALRTLAGVPFVGRQTLWHLWHPPQARLNRKVGNEANDALRAAYTGARFCPRRMRELIEEGRCHSIVSSPPK
jgi:hypothetical protein